MWHQFKTWEDIANWCADHQFNNIAKRMERNVAFWNSCGEFWRSQKHICDNICYSADEEEALEFAEALDNELADDPVIQ